MIILEVLGRPAPQGSKRPVRLGNGKMGMVESSKHAGPWREAVRGEAQQIAGQAIAGAVSVEIVFRLARPREHYRTGKNAHLLKDGAPGWPTARPDIDKLARATLDGLKMGGLIADDSLIVSLRAVKLYCPAGRSPGADIRIQDLSAYVVTDWRSPDLLVGFEVHRKG